jgi:hypothetical protein
MGFFDSSIISFFSSVLLTIEGSIYAAICLFILRKPSFSRLSPSISLVLIITRLLPITFIKSSSNLTS